MAFEFDPAKDAANIAKHGLSLADFHGFEGEPVLRIDDRGDYGELRLRALGWMDGKPYVAVYTWRGSIARLISLRRAHAKEVRQYEQGR